MSSLRQGPDWNRVAARATELLLNLEAAAALDERFTFRGTSLWPLVRDGFFERPGGVLEWALAAEGFELPASAANGGSRPLPGIPTMLATANRMLAAPTGRAKTLVLTPHPRWSDPWQPELGEAVTVYCSRFTGRRGGAPLMRERRSTPWEAGLRVEDLPVLVRARSRHRVLLESVWAETAFQQALPDSASSLRTSFVSLSGGLALAEALLRAAARLIAAIRPTTIVSFDALGNAGRAFAAEGSKAGVEVIGIQTGVISPAGLTNLGYRLDLASPTAPRPNRVLVWGAFYVDLLSQFGWPFGSVEIGGLPGNGPAIGEGKSILYLATANEAVCRAVARPEDELAIISALLEVGGADLTVRLHPSHSGTTYAHRVRQLVEASGGYIDPPSKPLRQTLAGAAVALGGGSTAVVEALRASVPTGVVALSGLELTGFAELGLPRLEQGTDPRPVIAELRRLPKSLFDQVATRVAVPATGRLARALRTTAVVG